MRDEVQESHWAGGVPVETRVGKGAYKRRFHIGAPKTLIIGGSLCVLGALWFASRLKEIRRLIRPIYRQLGIIPEVASGNAGRRRVPHAAGRVTAWNRPFHFSTGLARNEWL
jgi:hypothetical protein